MSERKRRVRERGDEREGREGVGKSGSQSHLANEALF